MAHLDYNKANEEFKDRVLEGIKETFPLVGNRQTVELEDLSVDMTKKHADDIKSQHAAKNKGDTWSAPVMGTLALKDRDGKVVQRKSMQLARLPMMTKRHSYIMDGQEWQVDNQWQLMPGVYTRRKNNGVLESQLNIPNAKEFSISFDPGTKEFMMSRGKSKKIPVYPLMKSLGVDDDTLERTWGKEILGANRNARGASTALEKFYRSDRKGAPKDQKEAEDYFRRKMEESKLRPESTRGTLGKPFNHIDGEVFTLATKRMLQVQAGGKEDDRDSLEFKDLRTAGDYVYDRLVSPKVQRSIRAKSGRKIDGATDLREVVKSDMFNDPIQKAFSKNSASRMADQVNPLEMLAASRQTTVTGDGGMQSAQAIDKSVRLKLINPSHLGFLDPVKTPEGPATGVSLRMPIGVTKEGKEPRVGVYNVKTSKVESLSPSRFGSSTIALPDQVTWDKGKPKFIGSSVKVSDSKNEISEVKPKDVDYVLQSPAQLFSVTTNLIPFLSSNSGNRATYAGMHMEQAISLKNREAPLIQVATGRDDENIASWEKVIGRNTSHTSPVRGTVSKVSRDGIVIKDPNGKRHTVQLYNNFPLNDRKSFLHSDPLVKVGDKVNQGQHLADTNFTKGGDLALGTNLNVAYIPYKGYNFEDGVVISRSAAEKLSSEHLYKPSIKADPDVITDVRKFKVQHPEAFTRDQYELLGEDGVVKKGQTVKPGDPLVIAMRPYDMKKRVGLDAIRKSMSGVHNDMSLRWDSDYNGKVIGVHRKRDGEVSVHVRTNEPMQVGDKLAGRYGNKGIVTLVVDNDKMPRTKSGRVVEVALNPSGVPGRMNAGQVLETAASKIAEKTGKPFIVDSFGRGSALKRVKDELKAHGLEDQEELIDADTGSSLGKALVGKQHIFKLTHQIDKKVAARSGMTLPGNTDPPEKYDANLLPAGGSGTGGQRIDPLTLYSLLSHGATANVREMQTWKSEGPDPQTDESKKWPSQHTAVWGAIQNGTPIPTPKTTFTFNKFTAYLKGAGIDVEKKGHNMHLSPMTDKKILAMSNGEITKPYLTYSKIDPKTGELKARPGGFFDERITGGVGGKRWGHLKLPEPIPNPIFEGAIQKVTGLKTKEYASLVTGEKAVDKNGKIVSLGTKGSVSGGAAVKRLLDGINVTEDLAAAEKALSKMTVPTSSSGRDTPKIDTLVKKVKYLRALKTLDMKPSEAYVLNNIPILPPALRNPSLLNDGSVRWDDINQLYKVLGEQTTELTPELRGALTDEMKKPFRAALYDGVSAVMLNGAPNAHGKDRGLIEQIAGTSPKKGFFQRQLMNRRQDLSMRSIIIPEPSLGLDEVGLPKDKALKIYQPFAVRKLQEIGAAPNTLAAQKLVAKKDPSVWRALDLVVKERPVLLKRDPVLHKHSVQAFQPKIVSGKAIKIHPLVTGGFNADFDGDMMSAYVPISREAVDEARKMFPSHNLYNEATGKVMYTPTLESALGLYKLSRTGGTTNKKYNGPADAIRDVQDGKLQITDVANVGGVKTTAGRLLLASSLPEDMRAGVLPASSSPIGKKELQNLVTDLATKHKADFGLYANRLKDLGNGAASGLVPIITGKEGPEAIAIAEQPKTKRDYVPIPVHTLGLDDFEPDESVRRKYLLKAQMGVRALDGKGLSRAEKDRRATKIWDMASQGMVTDHMKKMEKKPTNLAIMSMAGVKPSVDQYRQMVLAPMVMTDATGAPMRNPVTSSYAEGLDVAGYWTQMHGARGGTLKKVQEVKDPGHLSKQLVQTAMSTMVVDEDCGTERGISMSVGSSDINDRVLAADFKSRGVVIPKGTVVTPSVLDRMRVAGKSSSAVVRSTLKCEHATGVCQKCVGVSPTGKFYDKGDNVGILAAQSLGERSVQITMKAFHTGGAAGGGGKTLSNFNRIEQLTRLPKNIPDSATIASTSGKIDKIEKDPTGVKIWVGDKVHHVGKDRTGLPLHENLTHATKQKGYKPWTPPKVGAKVTAGQLFSDPNRTFVNPHDLYKATNNMEQVQNFLTDELYDIYKPEGVRRQHVETMVHSMGQLTKVQDPGDSDLLRGDFQNASQVRAINKGLAKRGKKVVEHTPVLKGINIMPELIQEDWMAKLQHEKIEKSLTNSAAIGAVSNIHGMNPVPGIAYGAEFGMSKKDSLTPGLTHLQDLADVGY